MIGRQIHDFAKVLWAINRSLTGEGVRETLRLIQGLLPKMEIKSVDSGTVRVRSGQKVILVQAAVGLVAEAFSDLSGGRPALRKPSVAAQDVCLYPINPLKRSRVVYGRTLMRQKVRTPSQYYL